MSAGPGDSLEALSVLANIVPGGSEAPRAVPGTSLTRVWKGVFRVLLWDTPLSTHLTPETPTGCRLFQVCWYLDALQTAESPVHFLGTGIGGKNTALGPPGIC